MTAPAQHPRLVPQANEIDPVTAELIEKGWKPLTDAGNGERFAEYAALTWRYVHQWDVWHLWDGKRWVPDHERRVVRDAVECVRAMRTEIPMLTMPTAKKVIDFALKSERSDRLAAMLNSARSHDSVSTTPDKLDRDPYALNVGNGTVDLKTGELSPHRGNALLTKLVAVDYDENAQAPTWEAFLAKVLPDEAVREYVRRAIGYSLSGDVGEHCLFVCYGSGRNGKTTLLETAQRIAGDYGKSAPPDLLLSKRTDRHEEEVAELHGARFVTAVEAGEGRYWDEARVKWLTGGDTLNARHMYQRRFQFPPSHHLWVATNHKPHARGTDLGFWRRVHLIPFAVTIPDAEVDHDLRSKLERELPGILRWAVEGARVWREGGLRPPKVVRDATDEYRSREDVLGHFIADCCVLVPQARATLQALHDSYTEWAEQNGERAMSKIDLASALEERPNIARYRSKSSRGLAGIGLRAGDAGDAGDTVSTSSHSARAGEKLSETASPASPCHPPGCRCEGDSCAFEVAP